VNVVYLLSIGIPIYKGALVMIRVRILKAFAFIFYCSKTKLCQLQIRFILLYYRARQFILLFWAFFGTFFSKFVLNKRIKVLILIFIFFKIIICIFLFIYIYISIKVSIHYIKILNLALKELIIDV